MSSLVLVVPMSDVDLLCLDDWFTEHGYNNQETRDKIIRDLIMTAVYS